MLNSSVEASYCECVFDVNTVLSMLTELIAVLLEVIATGFRSQATNLHSLESNSRIHKVMNKAQSSTSTAKCLAIPNQARTRKSPVRMN